MTIKDKNAVAVVRPLSTTFTEAIIPISFSKKMRLSATYHYKCMSHYVSKFLEPQTNSGKAIVTGKHINQGAGYGLEIPFNYIFYWDNQVSIAWLRENIGSTCILHEIGSSSADSYHVL